MSDPGYGPKPTNKIVVAGEPLVQILKISTVANMYPGRLVKRGATDGEIQVAAATTDAAIGWVGYEHTHKKHRPASGGAIYLDDAHVAVLGGGHFVLVARLLSGQTISKGARLSAAAAGCVSAGTNDATDFRVAIAEESVTAACTGAGCDGTANIMVRSLI